MKIQEEYAVFATHLYGSTTTYYFAINDDKKGLIRSQGYYFIPYVNRYSTEREAIGMAKKFVEMGIFKGEVNVINDCTKLISDVTWAKVNQYKDNVFVMKVPVSYYVGEKWADILKYMNDERYTDDKPYQLYGHETADIFAKDKWLVYNSPNDFYWVEDRFDATFFNKEDAKKIADIVNGIRRKEIPYKEYVRISELPLRLNETPSFEKGDKVFMLTYENCRNSWAYQAYYGEICDVSVIRNKRGEKEFAYAFDNNPYVDKFLEKGYFMTKDEIISKGGKFYSRGYDNFLDFNGRTYKWY